MASERVSAATTWLDSAEAVLLDAGYPFASVGAAKVRASLAALASELEAAERTIVAQSDWSREQAAFIAQLCGMLEPSQVDAAWQASRVPA